MGLPAQHEHTKASLLPPNANVCLLASNPANVYSAPLWSVANKSALVDLFLSSGLEFAWTSSDRDQTRLTFDTATDLQRDLADVEEDENGHARRWTLIGSSSLPPIRELSDHLSNFLQSGDGLELVIHQCNDSDEYIFLARNPTKPTLDLLNQLIATEHAKPTFQPLWINQTRKTGTLPA